MVDNINYLARASEPCLSPDAEAIEWALDRAFAAGAEAMREAAAQWVVENHHWRTGGGLAGDIRALPLPERKP